MGIKERKAREKTDRRNAILKAAKRLIGKHGVDGMSMNRLADLTELNKATLYCYYANKDDLIDAIVLEGLRRLEEEIAKAENGAATGLERMLTVTRTTFDFYRRHAVHFQAMNHREHRASDARTTPSAVEGDEVAARIFEWVRKSVERGMEDGSIRKGIDVDSFLVLHFAHVHGVMHTIQGKPDVYVDVLGLTAEDVEASALGFVEYFLDGREKR